MLNGIQERFDKRFTNMIAQDFRDRLTEQGFARARFNSDSTTSSKTHIENAEKAEEPGVVSALCDLERH